MVLVFSFFLLKGTIVKKQILGIGIGLVGAILLILYGNNSVKNASNIPLGNFLVFINATSYGLYLVLVKNLISKYNPLVFIKWLYLFGLIYIIPFGMSEMTEINWISMPSVIYIKIGFVILCTTCITYLFNLYGLSKLKPTTVSVFIYLQPVIASTYALIVGSDSLNIIKVTATLIIFLGVYLVTKQTKKSIK